MTETTNIFAILDSLIDQWCERRALTPLRHVLPVYPPGNLLTDGWHQLYDALCDVRATCRDIVSEEEMRKLIEVIIIIQNMLENR
ncbi:MAG: hypothetical protein QOF61_1020 [Acidobacteriota bacterium]|jgi:hypothetical protein|nr:hypothetical protein [Acidobacteriota bacterium]